MIAEAIERIRELALAGDEIRTLEHEGQTFSTRKLHRMPDERPVPVVASLEVATLSSLADYLNDDPDEMETETFVSVLSATRVEVVTPTLGEDAQRKTYAIAWARLPVLRIGEWVSPEDLGVHLRTCFEESPERDEVVAFLGGISDKTDIQTKDDGISQSATVRSGLSMLKEGSVPSPVELRPFRTFHDAEQPGSPFILRLKKASDGRGAVAALFEADGGAWQHDAAEAVAEYLRAACPDYDIYA